jgi:Protein of unknown function (DUF3592)
MLFTEPSQVLWRIYLRLLLIGIALSFVIWFGWLRWTVVADRSIPVDAILVKADRVSQAIKSGGGKLLLEYRYSFGSSSFSGDQATFGSRWFWHAASSNSELVSTVDALIRGKPSTVQIWVDPKNPIESALLKRVHPGLTVVTVFFALALLIGFIRAFIDIKVHSKLSVREQIP